MSRGDSLIFQFNVIKAPTPSSGPSPQDITDWFFWFTMKRTFSDPDQLAVAQLTTTPSSVPPGGAITILQPVSGIGQVSVPPIATRGFPDGTTRLVYDIQGKDAAGNIFTVERGEIEVEPDVTNSIGG